jgi:hypothetical protein
MGCVETLQIPFSFQFGECLGECRGHIL